MQTITTIGLDIAKSVFQVQHQANQAYDACTKAVATFPTELRYQYQLGRAAQFKDRKQAFEILSRFVQANYAAAFNNLGGIYLWDRKDASTAIALFKRGSALDDADSMTSFVDLIDNGLIRTPNPEQTKSALLHRAAELGHARAQRAYDAELQNLTQERINQANQQQMMQLFGAFVQGVATRWLDGPTQTTTVACFTRTPPRILPNRNSRGRSAVAP